MKDPIADYLSKVEEPNKTELKRIREIVKEIIPDAIEVLSYGMPGFRYQGQYLLGYAAFKDHLSLFPTPGPIKELKNKLKGYKVAKGTIQFDKEHPIPKILIVEIVKIRLKSISDGEN